MSVRTSEIAALDEITAALAILAPPILGESFRESFLRGMTLLVAASPGAPAPGTPASVLAGVATAARNGVLIKDGLHPENLGRLKAVAFDRIGTITRGRPARPAHQGRQVPGDPGLRRRAAHRQDRDPHARQAADHERSLAHRAAGRATAHAGCRGRALLGTPPGRGRAGSRAGTPIAAARAGDLGGPCRGWA